MSRASDRAARTTLVLSLFLLTACRPPAGAGRRATAPLADVGGRDVGTLTLRDAPGQPLTIEGELQGLPAGTHGIHFHAVGQCDATGAFASAGAHFNPASRKHGLESPDGPHAGDLPNLVVAADGRATVRLTSSRVTLGREAGSLLDADGSAVVVHAAADDQRTDPSGNSGGRIACAVIAPR
jgi:Cu-Zn family superoxide dismutase